MPHNIRFDDENLPKRNCFTSIGNSKRLLSKLGGVGTMQQNSHYYVSFNAIVTALLPEPTALTQLHPFEQNGNAMIVPTKSIIFIRRARNLSTVLPAEASMLLKGQVPQKAPSFRHKSASIAWKVIQAIWSTKMPHSHTRQSHLLIYY